MTSITASSISAPQQAATIVDEAFADLPDLAVRVDEAQSALTSGKYVAETERLVSRIARQLQAIEQQRSRLVQLLRGLEVAEKAETSGRWE